QSVQHLLRQLSLPLTSTNISLVSYLKDEGIPFTKTFVQTASAFLEKTSLEQGMEVLKYMIGRKLPLKEQIFQSLYRFVSADKPLLAQLQQIADSLQANSQNSPQVQRLTERLATILNELTHVNQNVETTRIPNIAGADKPILPTYKLNAEQPVSMPVFLKQ